MNFCNMMRRTSTNLILYVRRYLLRLLNYPQAQTGEYPLSNERYSSIIIKVRLYRVIQKS